MISMFGIEFYKYSRAGAGSHTSNSLNTIPYQINVFAIPSS